MVDWVGRQWMTAAAPSSMDGFQASSFFSQNNKYSSHQINTWAVVEIKSFTLISNVLHTHFHFGLTQDIGGFWIALHTLTPHSVFIDLFFYYV